MPATEHSLSREVYYNLEKNTSLNFFTASVLSGVAHRLMYWCACYAASRFDVPFYENMAKSNARSSTLLFFFRPQILDCRLLRPIFVVRRPCRRRRQSHTYNSCPGGRLTYPSLDGFGHACVNFVLCLGLCPPTAQHYTEVQRGAASPARAARRGFGGSEHVRDIDGQMDGRIVR